MSRTPFAREFCACLDQTPIHYLTEWRMHIASRRLACGIPVNIVSDQLGYASPISFARTFKRIVGVNPGNFRKCRADAGAPDSEGPRRGFAGARDYAAEQPLRRSPPARQ
jgi:AraC-like DNA-binding protein